MALLKGIYAAGLSVLKEDLSLDVKKTIEHHEHLIKEGLNGTIFFGSTGQGQLISIGEKKRLISELSHSKYRDSFFLGTGVNSLRDNRDLISHSFNNGFDTFLIMPPAYYVNNTHEGVYKFYANLIQQFPKIKIILYNFQKLSRYLFSPQAVEKLVKDFPEAIRACKDSSYNLYEILKIPGFSMFPGSETKLLHGLQNGASGIISAVTNVTYHLAKKVYDDFNNNREQTVNNKLCAVRKAFDDTENLISALHSFKSVENKNYKRLLPPLTLLSTEKQKELLNKLRELNFIPRKNIAA
jgi:4-hydroxy-tetrahydrodipicolinate synthase